MDAANIFGWILLAFPVYLLIKGRLTVYLGLLTSSGGASTGTAPGASVVPAPISAASPSTASTTNAAPGAGAAGLDTSAMLPAGAADFSAGGNYSATTSASDNGGQDFSGGTSPAGAVGATP